MACIPKIPWHDKGEGGQYIVQFEQTVWPIAYFTQFDDLSTITYFVMKPAFAAMHGPHNLVRFGD